MRVASIRVSYSLMGASNFFHWVRKSNLGSAKDAIHIINAIRATTSKTCQTSLYVFLFGADFDFSTIRSHSAWVGDDSHSGARWWYVADFLIYFNLTLRSYH